MAARLISRQKFIPYGFKFNQPEINWQARRNTSFDQVVKGLIHARLANAAALAKYKWATDYDSVANEVDQYNARICLAHGWDEYVSTGAEAGMLPKSQAPNQQIQPLQSLVDAAVKARELVAGAKSLIEWKDSGDPAVEPALSEHRAIICTTCPKNEAGDWTKWFTVPAAEMIRRQISDAQARKLSTPRDAQLHLCTACHCPLKLKVHVPIAWIVKRLTEPQRERLREAPNCWILNEADRL